MIPLLRALLCKNRKTITCEAADNGNTNTPHKSWLVNRHVGTLYYIGWCFFFNVFVAEVHPLTGSLTSVYNQISNSTLTAAYQHGEGLALTGYSFKTETLPCTFEPCFFSVSDEAEIQAIFRGSGCTASPESHGRRPHTACVEVGEKPISKSFQVCFHY